MSDLKNVHFTEFKTDDTKYTLQEGVGVYTQVTISGQIYKEGFSGFTVNVNITKPDGTVETLNLTPSDSTDTAVFEAPYNLDENSPIGQYILNATYIQPSIKSPTITFQVN